MSCNCKNSSVNDILDGKSNIDKKQKFFKLSLKIIAFLLLILMLPILNLYIIWIIFNVLVLNKSLDIMPLLKKIGDNFKDKDEDDEIFLGNEYDNISESDVVLLDTIDITDEVDKNN